MKDNVKWTIVKGHSRRGNRLERVVLFVLFRDFSALSNSNLLKQATAKSDNLYSEKRLYSTGHFSTSQFGLMLMTGTHLA